MMKTLTAGLFQRLRLIEANLGSDLLHLGKADIADMADMHRLPEISRDPSAVNL